MDCQRCRELLTEYIDGRLSVETSAALAAHLEECADCRALESELRATIALVSGLEKKPAPENFAETVTARMERRLLLEGPARPAKSRVVPWSFAGLGLAAAAALVAAFFIWNPFQERRVIHSEREESEDLVVASRDDPDRASNVENGMELRSDLRVEAREAEMTGGDALTELPAGAAEGAGRARAAGSLDYDEARSAERDGAGLAALAERGARLGVEAETERAVKSETLARSSTRAADGEAERAGGEAGGRSEMAAKEEARTLGYFGSTADRKAEEVAATVTGRAGAGGTPAAGPVPAAAPSEPAVAENGRKAGEKVVEHLYSIEDKYSAAVESGYVAADTAKRGDVKDGPIIPRIEFYSERGAIEAATVFTNGFLAPERQMKLDKPSIDQLRKNLKELNIEPIELNDERAVLQAEFEPQAIVSNNAVLVRSKGLSQRGETPEVITSQLPAPAAEQVAGDEVDEEELQRLRARAQTARLAFQKALTVQYVFIRRLPPPPAAPPPAPPPAPAEKPEDPG